MQKGDTGSRRLRILVLCTGNSARSQMAEGLIRHVFGDRVEVYSAGTRPAGYVHPLAIEVMREIGVDIAHQRSKSTDEFRNARFDVVITVCDDAARECPTWLGEGTMVHVGFPDPAAVAGDEAARLDAFRSVRDAITRRLLPLVAEKIAAE